MGLLDDAIREHLELKRRLGADEGEIKELEDEAFGPPTRPGEPDFPSAGGEAPASQATAEPIAPEGEVRAPAPETAEHQTLQGLIGEQPERPSEPPTAEELEEPTEAPAEALTAQELREPSTFSTEEREEIAGQPTEIHEADSEEDLELGDLDLELDEELEEVGELAEEPLPAEGGLADEPLTAEPAPGEEPFTSEEEIADEAFLEDEGLAEPASAGEESAEPQPAQPEDDDVLEETPEFLRDNPDDDELWFEQGEPKDFDL